MSQPLSLTPYRIRTTGQDLTSVVVSRALLPLWRGSSARAFEQEQVIALIERGRAALLGWISAGLPQSEEWAAEHFRRRSLFPFPIFGTPARRPTELPPVVREPYQGICQGESGNRHVEQSERREP
ncbi:MAG: hypothetical protein JNL42_02395 [Anaerolineae bacterium]|nr:hypothetical protein [Anaerolineae bacterium]